MLARLAVAVAVAAMTPAAAAAMRNVHTMAAAAAVAAAAEAAALVADMMVISKYVLLPKHVPALHWIVPCDALVWLPPAG
jgi:hypothetical protein